IAEDPAAHSPDHRAVATHDRLGERAFSPFQEAIQELPVRESPQHPRVKKGLEVVDQLDHVAFPIHVALSILLACPLRTYYPVESVFIHFFCERTGSPTRRTVNANGQSTFGPSAQRCSTLRLTFPGSRSREPLRRSASRHSVAHPGPAT